MDELKAAGDFSLVSQPNSYLSCTENVATAHLERTNWEKTANLQT